MDLFANGSEMMQGMKPQQVCMTGGTVLMVLLGLLLIVLIVLGSIASLALYRHYLYNDSDSRQEKGNNGGKS